MALIILSCQQREWNNPFDPECPKEIFTPGTVTAIQRGNEILVSWSQNNRQISGFKLYQNTNDGIWVNIASLTKDEQNWTVNGIEGGKKYGFNVVAVADGNWSNEKITYLTPLLGATIKTTSISAINSITANSGGNITSDGGSPVTARGVCWNTSPNPTIANSKTIDGLGTGIFTSNLTGLTNNTTYYVRAYATNATGTSYGNEMSFPLIMNLPGPTLTDIDGNVYKTVKIGNQVWMAENLKVTKYRNGNAIPNVTDGATWASLSSGAYCSWGNSTFNAVTYGYLYNFYSVVDSRQICPVGWHVPSQSEWTTLINYLGGEKVAGAKLKEGGSTHWVTSSGDNSSGFTGLGGSWRGGDGAFYYYPGQNGCFWTTTLSNNIYDSPWTLFLTTAIDVVFNNDSYHTKKAGNSVRCIKD